MQKLVLMSVLIATFAIPMMHASHPNPKRALRKMQTRFAVFCAIYVIAIVYIMPRL